jgi:integrase/recombinase XerD
MNAPLVTVFVRHSPGCKYVGDEFCKRCNCRKHLRWTQDGKQYRRMAGTRSWQAGFLTPCLEAMRIEER